MTYSRCGKTDSCVCPGHMGDSSHNRTLMLCQLRTLAKREADTNPESFLTTSPRLPLERAAIGIHN